MTKMEHDAVREFLDAVIEAVDFDAIGSRMGDAANAVKMVLDECVAEGFDPEPPLTAPDLSPNS